MSVLARKPGFVPVFVGVAVAGLASGATPADVDRQPEISPVLGIERNASGIRSERPGPRQPGQPADRAEPSFDGSGNNLANPEMGAAGTPLLRWLPAAYGDGISSLAGADRPSPRAISQAVNAQDGSRPNPQGLSDMFWQWGQFVDHDIDLTDGADPAEPAPIRVPSGDPWFDPAATGIQSIPMNRSLWEPGTGTSDANPRQQVNEITTWIDGSNIYGSDEARSEALRTLDGTGTLKVSAGGLLPFNVDGLPNAGGPAPTHFLAGDVRANEQIGLTAMHTLFVREHNRLALEIAERRPGATGDEIHAEARRWVTAYLQVITYRDFLPPLIGRDALPPYRGYRPEADGSIRNSFSSAAFRLGHTLLSPVLLRLDANGEEIPAGHLSLADAFFSPNRLIDEGGIEPVLRGLAAQVCEDLDIFVVDEIRNFLFGLPGSSGLDLASLNIQRGRDHGLPSYNAARAAVGLRPVRRFEDISRNREVVDRLASVYASADDIDLWVGALAEDAIPGALVGPLHQRLLANQFTALRDADRFWYEHRLTDRERRIVEHTTLADIIRRNTTIGQEIDDNVFRVR